MIICGKFPKLEYWNNIFSTYSFDHASSPLMSRNARSISFFIFLFLLPFNWITHLPPQVCASGLVLADNQTSGPLHKVDGIQHQRREQFGLERCQQLFVLIQIPACTEIFLIAARTCCMSSKSLLENAVFYHYVNGNGGVGLLVVLANSSHSSDLPAYQNESECCLHIVIFFIIFYF